MTKKKFESNNIKLKKREMEASTKHSMIVIKRNLIEG